MTIPPALIATGAFAKYNGWRQILFAPMSGLISIVIPVGVGSIIRKRE